MKNSTPVMHLKAGATEFLLASDFNAYCDLEAEFGEGINQVIKRFTDTSTLRMTDIRRYLGVILRSGDEQTPIDQRHAYDICAAAGIEACTNAVTTHLMCVVTFK